MDYENLYKEFKSRDLVDVTCSKCHVAFKRRKADVLKRLRKGHSIYCSRECIKVDKTTRCLNCGKLFDYEQIGQKYCSRSCAAVINNSLYPKKQRREAKRDTCLHCNAKLNSETQVKYCDNDCRWAHDWQLRLQTVDPDDISKVMRNPKIMKRYIIEKYGHACTICGLTEWQGKPAPLVLDHIDGNAENNAERNLRLVCGNCNMQLPTFSGRNRGNGRAWRRERRAKGKNG